LLHVCVRTIIIDPEKRIAIESRHRITDLVCSVVIMHVWSEREREARERERRASERERRARESIDRERQREERETERREREKKKEKKKKDREGERERYRKNRLVCSSRSHEKSSQESPLLVVLVI
jgi:hypothetical protein